MSLPLATTKIAVQRRELGVDDPYEATAPWDTVAACVPAHIGAPSGREVQQGDSQEVVTDRLDCDLVDVAHSDRVVDESTGLVYEVVWTRVRRGLGLDHVEAGLIRVQGVV